MGGHTKSILTILVAFVLFGFTLTSCKKCDKNKLAGGDGKVLTPTPSGDNGGTTDGSTIPPLLTQAQKLAIYVKEQLGKLQAARARLETFNAKMSEKMMLEEIRKTKNVADLVANKVGAGTDVPKDVAADVAQVHREKAAVFEVERKIFVARKSATGANEPMIAAWEAEAWRNATIWAMRAGMESRAREDVAHAKAAVEKANNGRVDNSIQMYVDMANRAVEEANAAVVEAEKALTKKAGL
jgi:hypothetical protein